MNNNAQCHPKKSFDYLLWGAGTIVVLLYFLGWQFQFLIGETAWLNSMAETAYSVVNTIWWGVAIGFVMLGLFSKVPQIFVLSILGKGGRFSGLLRAAFAGVLLDLCSHGIGF